VWPGSPFSSRRIFSNPSISTETENGTLGEFVEETAGAKLRHHVL
jgi:hypothetical protein